MVDDISYAQPCDIYIDERGEVWQIIGVVREPCVIAQRLTADGTGERQTGGVSGLMWQGFRRVHEGYRI